jgi:type IV pilus assembly protein PilY1
LAQDGPLDARSIRPAVMLLVDTSGSMERIPDDGSNPSCDECVPTCTGDTLIDRNNKTRWALTVEALTGTIQNYRCTSENRTSSNYQRSDYDYGYYLPHINFTNGFTPGMTQATDGILDSFASRVKFGLMTFDGVGTTIGGETLVPNYSTWFVNDAFATAANGAAGMYSYGPPGRLAFPGCPTDYGINAGARGEGNFPGALISIPRSDAVNDALAVNTSIQQSLLQVRPFGGTPIAGMLDDLRYYLKNNVNVNRSGDPLYECRNRKAILITDGAPDSMFRRGRFNCQVEEGGATVPDCNVANTHRTAAFPKDRGCDCPYRAPEVIAAAITNHDTNGLLEREALLDELIVVAYNVHDQEALRTLNEIALAAGAEEDADEPSEFKYVVHANGAGELRQKLDQKLNASQAGVTSRSVPVSVNVGDPAISGSNKRFDVTAGFQVGHNTTEPWQGLLYRGRAVCEGTTVTDAPYSISEGDVFHETLTVQSRDNQRSLLTVTPQVYGPVNGSLVNTAYRPTQIKPSDAAYDPTRLTTSWEKVNVRYPNGDDVQPSDPDPADRTPVATQGAVTTALNLPDVDSPNFVNTSALNPLYFGDATRDGLPGLDTDRTAVINYVLGRDRLNALADIYHSQPSVMLPVNRVNESRFTTIDARYTSWLRALIANTTGSHYTDGRPGVVFVGTNDGVLHAFNLDDWQNRGTTVDGSRELWGFVPPALFGKMASMLDAHQIGFDGSPEIKDVVLQRRVGGEPIFRTILVSAVRGASAFIALDVTYPEDPVFLWQFSAPEVGNTVANVGLTQVNVNWGGNGEQVRAVAILPGGQGVACTGSRRPTAGRTRAEYPTGGARDVQCWNRLGRALYVVDVATGQVIQEFGPDHFPSPLTGSVVVDSSGVTTASAAYFFDEDGILWRLSMLSTDPRNWKAAPIYDMFSTPPVPSDTSLASYQLGRRPAYAPTLLRDKTGNIVLLAGTGDVDSPRDTARHRVVSLTEVRGAQRNNEISAEIRLNWQIDLNQNEAVTGPLTVFQDVVYFGTFQSGATSLCSLGTSRLWGAHAYEPLDRAATLPAPTPRLTRRNAGPGDAFVLNETYNDNSLVLGVTVKQQPVCQSATRIPNAITQQSIPTQASGGGAFQLVGVMAGGSSGGSTRGGDISRGAVVETNPQTIRVMNNTKVTSWASMFE